MNIGRNWEEAALYWDFLSNSMELGCWLTVDAQLRPVDLVVLTRLNFMDVGGNTTHCLQEPCWF